MTKEYIIEIRKKSGFTQIELAEKMRIPLRTLKAWESGKQEPLFINQKSLRFWCKKGIGLLNYI